MPHQLFPVPLRTQPPYFKQNNYYFKEAQPEEHTDEALSKKRCGVLFCVNLSLVSVLGIVLAAGAIAVFIIDREVSVSRNINKVWKILAVAPFIMVVSVVVALLEGIFLRVTQLLMSTRLWQAHLYLSSLRGVWTWITCDIVLLVIITRHFDIPDEQQRPLVILLGYILAYFIFDIPRRLYMRAFLFKHNNEVYASKVQTLSFVQVVLGDLKLACAGSETFRRGRSERDDSAGNSKGKNTEMKPLVTNVEVETEGGTPTSPTQRLPRHRSTAASISCVQKHPPPDIHFASLAQSVVVTQLLTSKTAQRLLATQVFEELIGKGAADMDSALQLLHFQKVFESFVAPKAFRIFFADLDGVKLSDEEVQIEMATRKLSKAKFLEALDRFEKQQANLRTELSAWDGLSTTLVKVTEVSQGVLVFLLSLLFAAAQVRDIVLPFTSVLLSISFAFGETLKNWLNSALFVTVFKPFSVGESVKVEGVPGGLAVREIKVVSTVFEDDEGITTVIPNYILYARTIRNKTRSDYPYFRYSLQIALDVPSEKLVGFERSVESYLASLPDVWDPTLAISWDSIDRMNSWEVTVKVRLLCNFTDTKFRLACQKNLLTEIRKRADEFGIKYLEPPCVVQCSGDV